MLMNALQQLNRGCFLTLTAALIATPVLAQNANFGTFTLLPGFSGSKVVEGYTNGSYALSNIAPSDRHQNRCLGYGDPTPDHIMVLQKNFSRLKLQVKSGGYDTTLLIRGPQKTVTRCGDDVGKNQEASVEDSNWQAGTYQIWVGSFEARRRRDYTLSVQEK
ncbi:MAG TPA: hypothetical protein V6D03_13725 [Candidatus Caenarcaniphilales bacterium]